MSVRPAPAPARCGSAIELLPAERAAVERCASGTWTEADADTLFGSTRMVFAAAVLANAAIDRAQLQDAYNSARSKHLLAPRLRDRTRKVPTFEPVDVHADTTASELLHAWSRVFASWHHLPRVVGIMSVFGHLCPPRRDSFAALQAFLAAGGHVADPGAYAREAFAALCPDTPDMDAFAAGGDGPAMQRIHAAVRSCIALFARRLQPWVRHGACLSAAAIVDAVPSAVVAYEIALAWDEGLYFLRTARRDVLNATFRAHDGCVEAFDTAVGIIVGICYCAFVGLGVHALVGQGVEQPARPPARPSRP
jgi:hypothetical protein